MNNQQLDFLRNSLDDANRRMEAVLERQTLMMQQFMKEQNEFRAYLEHKPEVPLQKPEVNMKIDLISKLSLILVQHFITIIIFRAWKKPKLEPGINITLTW